MRAFRGVFQHNRPEADLRRLQHCYGKGRTSYVSLKSDELHLRQSKGIRELCSCQWQSSPRFTCQGLRRRTERTFHRSLSTSRRDNSFQPFCLTAEIENQSAQSVDPPKIKDICIFTQPNI